MSSSIKQFSKINRKNFKASAAAAPPSSDSSSSASDSDNDNEDFAILPPVDKKARKEEETSVKSNEQMKPVWSDEDDDNLAMLDDEAPPFLSIQQLATKNKLKESEKIDDSDSSSSDDDDENDVGYYRKLSVLPRTSTTTTSSTTEKNNKKLNKLKNRHCLVTGQNSSILVRQLKDANSDACPHSNKRIVTVKFHPKLRDKLLLTASNDGSLQLFDITTTKNESSLLHSHVFERTRLSCAVFSRSGDTVYMTSDFHDIKIYDIISNTAHRICPSTIGLKERLSSIVSSPTQNLLFVCGKQNQGYFLDPVTEEIISTIYVDGAISSAAFVPNKPFIHIGAAGGNFVFDIRQMTSTLRVGSKPTCSGHWSDHGLGVDGAQSMAFSLQEDEAQQIVACGTKHGFVQIYSYSQIQETLFSTQQQQEQQEKSISSPFLQLNQLKTNINSLCFHPSPSKQLLAFASSAEPKAMRLYDVNERKMVVMNLTISSPITAIEFGDTHLVAGTQSGRAILYKCHF